MKGSLAAALILLPVAAWGEPACKVAIDIGHFRQSPGATSARGEPEWVFNGALARKLDDALRRLHIATILLNPAGESIDLRQRPADALAAGATLFVSIHHDSVQDSYLSRWQWGGQDRLYSDNFSGYGLFVSAKNPAFEESLAVAHAVGDHLLAIGLHPSLHHAEPIAGENRPLLDAERGIYRYDDLVVLKTSEVPALLIEAGVIVNRQDELILSQDGFRQRFAEAVAGAIAERCRH
jgi:N-acetylmuramoyl-L-alanine amidase